MTPWQDKWTVAEAMSHLSTIFAKPADPKNMLCAILILSIMILPIIVAVALDVLRQVPSSYREAALGLGATRWEVIRLAVWPQSRIGFAGGCILALGRAMGETMAVTMVIGNGLAYHKSVLQSSDTVASTIANQFDGSTELREAALIEMALLLFAITLITSLAARFIIQARPDNSSWIARLPSLLLSRMFWPIRRLRDAIAEFSERNRAPGVLAPTNWNIKGRRVVNFAVIGLMTFLLLLCVLPLVSVLSTLIVRGSQSLSIDFLTTRAKPVLDGGGGIAHAILGSFCLLGVATAFAVPLGLAKGIFLARRGETRLAKVVRPLLDAMTGIPAIIVGVFCYTVLVRPTGLTLNIGHSMLAGGLALAMIMLPIFSRMCEQAMTAIPRIYDEAGLALGLSRRKVILRIILRAATPAVLTGLFLALSRVGGEAAPLLFTAFGSNELPTDPTEPCSSLPQYMFANYNQPFDVLVRNSWGAALVLVVLILGMRLITNYISLKKFGRGGIHV
jgi:phosphate transport system permease protein